MTINDQCRHIDHAAALAAQAEGRTDHEDVATQLGEIGRLVPKDYQDRIEQNARERNEGETS